MANRDPVRQKKGKAKKPIPDALLSGSEYDYQDEDVQSTTAIAGSQEAFGEQHNTTVIPQPPSGKAKAKEGFSLTEAMKSMWSVLMLEREDRQKEREYQDRKEMLEREDRQKEREYHERKEMQWKIDLAKRDEEALQKQEWAREAQEQKEERARVAQEMRDAALREEMAKQSEEQRAWEAQRQRQHFLAQNLPKYDGHEQLDTFLQRFEEILTEEGVPTEQWVQLLTRALTGKPATLLTTVLSPEVKASYPLTKETLLASVGLSFHHYVDELFTPNKVNDTHSCTTPLTPYLDPSRNHRTGPTTQVNRGGQMVPGDFEKTL